MSNILRILLTVPIFLQANIEPRLWVRQADEVVEYDFNSFEKLRSVKTPASLGQLKISRAGQVLGTLPNDQVWFWDGKSARTFPSGASATEELDVSVIRTEVAPSWFLSADGTHLFVAENTFRKVLNASVEHYLFTWFKVRRTDLDGRQAELIAEHELRQCACETGVCSDTCPQGMLSASGGVVAESFLVRHWTPGLREPQFHESFIYWKTDTGWSDRLVEDPVTPTPRWALRVDSGRLSIIENASNLRRETPIAVRTAADVFLVER